MHTSLPSLSAPCRGVAGCAGALMELTALLSPSACMPWPRESLRLACCRAPSGLSLPFLALGASPSDTWLREDDEVMLRGWLKGSVMPDLAESRVCAARDDARVCSGSSMSREAVSMAGGTAAVAGRYPPPSPSAQGSDSYQNDLGPS